MAREGRARVEGVMFEFRDRAEAGRRLGAELLRLRDDRPIVLALPRGGVPVALEVARALEAPLEVLVARKLGAPRHPEFGFGAIAEAGATYVDRDSVLLLDLGRQELEEVAAVEREELVRRVAVYRGGRPLPSLDGRTVILVDDGVATGSTACAAARAARALGAGRVVLAVPVAAAGSARWLRSEVDELVTLDEPEDLSAISLWYGDFRQVPDSEVLELLQQARDAGVGDAAVPSRPRDPEAPDGCRVELALLGDVMLGRGVELAMRNVPPAAAWNGTLPVLHHSDARVCNLECTLTTQRSPWSRTQKLFHFQADPGLVEVLRTARIDAVSLANNHALDFEEEGLLETLAVLRSAGIRAAGAGANLDEARGPALLEVRGVRIALVACTDQVPEFCAGARTPGTSFLRVSMDGEALGAVERMIESARRAGAEMVVFSNHWGPHLMQRPAPLFRRFARAVIDRGADVFYGHGAHLFHGVELYRGRPILYDTGDFLDDYVTHPYLHNDWSFVFRVRLYDGPRFGVEMVPVVLSRAIVEPARGYEASAIMERMEELSAELGTRLVRRGDRLVLEEGEGAPLELEAGAAP